MADRGHPFPTVPAVLCGLMLLQSVTFLVGAYAHLGQPIPLGFATIDEPQILPATIVESLCGISLGVGAFGLLTHRRWGWHAALAAHLFSIFGVLVGITALALGGGPRSSLNDIYHLVILAVLGVSTTLLLTLTTKSESGRSA